MKKQIFKGFYRITLLSAMFSLLFNSCQKGADSLDNDVKSSKKEIVYKELTQDEIKLRSKLERRAMITLEVMKDKNIQQLYVDAISKITKANYRNEEAIPFSELFNKNGVFPELSNKFSKRFLEVYYSHEYYNSANFPKPDNTFNGNNDLKTRGGDDFLNFSDGSQVYFPYSELFSGNSYSPTVSSAPINNVHQNGGVIYNNGSYKSVTVNDDYAEGLPTYLVNVGDRGGSGRPFSLSPDFGGWSTEDPVVCNTTGTAVTTGFFTATDHFDGLFEGGSEFRFTRSKTELTVVNGKITQIDGIIPRTDIIPIDVTRSRIHWMDHWDGKGNLHQDEAVPVGTVWEQTWEPNELSIPFCLFEEDNMSGNHKFDVEGRIKLDSLIQFDKTKIPIDINLGFNLHYKADYNIGTDDVIFQSAFERSTFMRLNTVANPVLKPGKYGCWRRWGLGNKCAITLIQE